MTFKLISLRFNLLLPNFPLVQYHDFHSIKQTFTENVKYFLERL